METNETPATTPETATTPVAVVEKPKRVSVEQFAEIWNAASSRNDVIARLAAAGFVMTYSAVVARAKAYTEGGIALKEMPNAPKGKRIDVAAVNAKLAQASQPTA